MRVVETLLGLGWPGAIVAVALIAGLTIIVVKVIDAWKDE